MKKYLLNSLAVVIVALMLQVVVQAQDAHFSQYYASGLYLNPALAGAEANMAFTSNYRSQWQSVAQPYVTNQMSWIMPISRGQILKRQMGAAGLSFYNDVVGDGNFKTTGIMGSFTYNSYFDDRMQVLSIGLQGGVVQQNIDFTNLEWGEQYNGYLGTYDPSITPTEAGFNTSNVYPDLSAGFVYYYNPQRNYARAATSGHLGMSAYHLTQPNASFSIATRDPLPFIVKIHGGMDFRLNERFSFEPTALTMYQANLLQLNTGMYLRYRAFISPVGLMANTDVLLGGWYRLGDAAIAMVGISNEAFTVGFSYDYNASSLRRFTGGRGAYEISLGVRFVKERGRRRFDTPRI